MSDYGLIGTSIRTSYSKCIHESISDKEYDLIQLDATYYVDEFLQTDFKGINVTRPYKEYLYKKCDFLSTEAKEIGVVNTVLKLDNKLYGYNTDAFGFEWLLNKENIIIKDKKCLIFGTGATSKTVEYILKKLGAQEIKFLSRNPDDINSFSYTNEEVIKDFEILINTTPTSLNRYEQNDLINFSMCKKAEEFIDVNYRPAITNLMWDANINGIKIHNGLKMLVAQAIRTQELFLNKAFDENFYENKYLQIKREITNISLIGHPFSGKTVVGGKLSTKLNKKYFDVDKEIESTFETTINDIFKEKGEEYFRFLETHILKTIMNSNGAVISTGGGIILNEENNRILKMGSFVINLERDINRIEIDNNRPLCKSKDDLLNLINERKNTYKRVANKTIRNDDIDITVQEIEDSL